MFTYLLTGSLGEYFLFYGLAKFYTNIALAWRHRFFLSKTLFRFFTRSLGTRRTPSVHDNISLLTDFPYPYFCWRKRGLFPLWDSSQSFSFYLLLPLSGDSLGQLYVHIPHSLSIQSQSANICWLPFWLGFVTSAARDRPTLLFFFLVVSLWQPANSNTKG